MNAEKAALRARMRALPQPAPAASAALCRRITDLPAFQAAGSVLAFYPMPAEPDIRPVLEAVLAAGKLLSLPRSLEEGILLPGIVPALDALVPGPWNIPEPPPGAPVPAQTDLVLVPGVAFDRSGRRLGHGAGYYDRFLAQTAAFSVGICFAQNLLAAVPAEAHDLPVQAIITEAETLRIR